MGWVLYSNDARLRDLWPGALDYVSMELPLRVAQIQCERFAPTLPEGAEIPDNYIAAQIMQARALVRAGIVGTGDQVGGYGETVTVFPMDWAVKNLLRPKRGKPVFR